MHPNPTDVFISLGTFGDPVRGEAIPPRPVPHARGQRRIKETMYKHLDSHIHTHTTLKIALLEVHLTDPERWDRDWCMQRILRRHRLRNADYMKWCLGVNDGAE